MNIYQVIDGDAQWLKLDGSNANDDIDIGTYDFETTGDISAANLTASADVTGNKFIIGGAITIDGVNFILTPPSMTIESTGGDYFDIHPGNNAITHSSGTISLSSDALTTSGKGTFGDLDVDTLNLNANVISDSTGTVSFDDDHITTSGNILTTGQVGAGTLTPTRILDVYDANPRIRYDRADSYQWEAGVGGTVGNIPSSFWGIEDMAFAVRLVIAHTTGYVGIGTTSPDTKLQVVGDAKFGDDNTNYSLFGTDGDLTFVGTAGLPFGCIKGTDETITCTVQNTWYQVTFDTAGPVNNVEADTANNELQVTYEGIYQVNVTACFHTNPSNDFELLVRKNDGGTDLEPHLFQTTAVANKVENTAGSCFIDISANDRVELWVRCTSAAGQDAVFDHVSLTLNQLGGT